MDRLASNSARSHADAPGWLALASLLLVYASVWTITRPYAGLIHDAKLYALQTLATIKPEIYAGDLFLRFGSQDSFTVFPRIYAPIGAAIGIEHAAAVLTFGISVLWLGTGFLIARALAGPRLALLSLGLLIAIPGWYGGYQVIHIGEMYLTARLPAELVALCALLALLHRKQVLAFALAVCAALVHPLMGLPVIGVLVLAALSRRFGPASVMPAAIAVVLCGALGALAIPVQPIDTLQEWVDIVRIRSGWLFPDQWRMVDWQYHALALLTLVLAARSAIDPRAKELATCALWLGLAGICLAWIAGALAGHPILLRIQPWRWMWVACFIAIIFLPLTVEGLWKQGAGDVGRTAAILLAAAWLLADSVGGFLAVAAVAVLYLPATASASSRRSLRRGAWIALTLACLTTFFAAIQYALNPFDTNLDSMLVQRVVNALGTGSFALVMVTAAWALASNLRPLAGRAALAAVAVAALALLTPRAIRDWTASSYSEPTRQAFAHWRAVIPQDAEVLWPADTMAIWLLLERRSYFSQDQLAGILYSPAMTHELLRRALALRPIASPEWWTLADLSPEAQPKDFTADTLAAVCRSPGLDFVVTGSNLGGSPLTARMPQRDVDLYLYECGAVSRNQGSPVRVLLRQATRYSLASAAALATDVAILVTLVEKLHWHYLVAATTSFVAGAALAYVLVTRFVFEYRRVRDRRLEFAIFVGIGLVGLVINGTTIYALVEYLSAPYLAAKAAAAGLTFFTNFIARRWLLFTHWPQASVLNPNR